MIGKDEQKPAKTEQRGEIHCRKCNRSWTAGDEGCGHEPSELYEVR